jgi:hypothetical protein
MLKKGNIEMENARVSVKQAACELHMGELTVRCLMQQGKLPIGYALKKDGKNRYGYYIYRGKLDTVKRELGIE